MLLRRRMCISGNTDISWVDTFQGTTYNTSRWEVDPYGEVPTITVNNGLTVSARRLTGSIKETGLQTKQKVTGEEKLITLSAIVAAESGNNYLEGGIMYCCNIGGPKSGDTFLHTTICRSTYPSNTGMRHFHLGLFKGVNGSTSMPSTRKCVIDLSTQQIKTYVNGSLGYTSSFTKDTLSQCIGFPYLTIKTYSYYADYSISISNVTVDIQF